MSCLDASFENPTCQNDVLLSRKKMKESVSTCIKDSVAAIIWKVVLLIYSICNHITVTDQYILKVFYA